MTSLARFGRLRRKVLPYNHLRLPLLTYCSILHRDTFSEAGATGVLDLRLVGEVGYGN